MAEVAEVAAPAAPPNPNDNVQHQPADTHTPGQQRQIFSTVAVRTNEQGAVEHGVVFPPLSGRFFAVRQDGIIHLRTAGEGATVRMLIDSSGLPHILIPRQNEVHAIPLAPAEDARTATANWRTQPSVHQQGHRQMQNQLLQQVRRNSPLGTLIHDVVYELGSHLASNELHSLAYANRHLYNSTAPRRQAIHNATLLARGEATIGNNGDIVRQNPPDTSPAQFVRALHHIQRLPAAHQRGPLQELVRRATTQAQFEAVFDHLQNLAMLPDIPLPANFAALRSAASQRTVTIFSWRLSGHTVGNPPAPSTQPRRDALLNGYANLMQGIEGMNFPLHIAMRSHMWSNYAGIVRPLLTAFGAPIEINANNARAWLNSEAQQGNLQLTSQIYHRLPVQLQFAIRQILPTRSREMRQANDYVNGTRPLHPTI